MWQCFYYVYSFPPSPTLSPLRNNFGEEQQKSQEMEIMWFLKKLV